MSSITALPGVNQDTNQAPVTAQNVANDSVSFTKDLLENSTKINAAFAAFNMAFAAAGKMVGR